MRSRITSRARKNSLTTIVITTIAITAILYMLVQYGLPVLVNASLFLAGKQEENVKASHKTTNFVEPAILDSLTSATNSATITVSGTSKKGYTINLYVNNQLVDKDTIDEDNFEFKNVAIEEGENTIKVKAVKGNIKSDFSDEHTVFYLKKAPEVNLESPSDNQNYSKDERTAQVKGKTDVNVKVTINDQWAISDGSGNFSYNFPLHDGENTIKIVATDLAGNKTEIERKVTYSP